MHQHQLQLRLSILVKMWLIDCDAVLYVALSWTLSRTEDLSIQCDTEALHGSLCWSLPMCPFSSRPCTPSGLRETLAFELLSCHFLLLENRETRRERWPTQICPSIKAYIHPCARLGEWTQPYPYSIHDYNQAASQTLLVRQLDHQGTPTQSSGPSFKVRVREPI